MAEMKNICGKIPIDLHEKVREEIELNESSTQQFLQRVIEEHFDRMEGEVNMGKRTLAVQVSEELFQKVKWALAKERMKQKDFLIAIVEKAVAEIEAKWQELEAEETGLPEEMPKDVEKLDPEEMPEDVEELDQDEVPESVEEHDPEEDTKVEGESEEEILEESEVSETSEEPEEIE